MKFKKKEVFKYKGAIHLASLFATLTPFLCKRRYDFYGEKEETFYTTKQLSTLGLKLFH